MDFFSLGPIETTFRKYTFHKNRFFLSPPAKNDQKMAKIDQKNFGQNISVSFHRDLALAVSVVLPPWDPFFDFSFPSYGRFREGTPHFVILSFCGVGGVPSRKRP